MDTYLLTTVFSIAHTPIVKMSWPMLEVAFFVQLMNMSMVPSAGLQVVQWRRSEGHKHACNTRISGRNMFSSISDRHCLDIAEFFSQQWKLQSGIELQMMEALSPMMHRRRRRRK
jgi:hypothetical protein